MTAFIEQYVERHGGNDLKLRARSRQLTVATDEYLRRARACGEPHDTFLTAGDR